MSEGAIIVTAALIGLGIVVSPWFFVGLLVLGVLVLAAES